LLYIKIYISEYKNKIFNSRGYDEQERQH